MFYRALGFAVWKGAKWYLGRRLPSRRLLVLGGAAATAAAVASVLAVGAKRDDG
jgi:hypothetical protein